MPVTPTYPGVYIEEISSGVHTITGVATSIAAFVGYTPRGLDNRATQVFSFADFERSFGGLAADSELSYAVQQFFQNGGNEAYVVRVPKHSNNVVAPDVAAAAASVYLLDGASNQSLLVKASSMGAWANELIIDVDYDGVSDDKSFNLTISDLATGTIETFDDVTMDNTKNNFVETVVNDVDSGSQLVSVSAKPASGRPAASGITSGDITLANIKNDKSYTIKLKLDAPAKSVEFNFITPADALPGSIASVCRLFQRQANAALAAAIPGAQVSCAPSSSGKGLRVTALMPNAYDAQVTFDSGATDDADAFLNLKAQNASANVSHYWPNSQRGVDAFAQKSAMPGVDGTLLPQADDLIGDPGKFSGIYALDKVDLFNILCLPDVTRAKPGNPAVSDLDLIKQNSVFGAAMTYCLGRRAFLLVDARPEVNDVSSAVDWKSTGLTVHDKNGAAYFPRLKLADPLNDFQLRTFAPCGIIAGLFARIDTARGVWKAPAGTEATLSGVQEVAYKLTDSENGVLNPLGLNCVRLFPVFGPVAWGARTLVGDDADASEWKYVPVRRLALFMEESLYRGTKWVVFEPNDEPLWAQIRLNVGAFMHDLFRQGAFQGQTPKDAYFVKCDKETTTQNDINRGIVNILVGFAPLKPAEFVIIKIQQIAGQIQT
ncbi:MAG TPA: phage tail sheath C-terminal domain-containing protein [Verrucomicrobiae bacterium]|nr:phage tail sheath C-terminal domain-containing protein [Verrucomicrobiae bacterium]